MSRDRLQEALPIGAVVAKGAKAVIASPAGRRFLQVIATSVVDRVAEAIKDKFPAGPEETNAVVDIVNNVLEEEKDGIAQMFLSLFDRGFEAVTDSANIAGSDQEEMLGAVRAELPDIVGREDLVRAVHRDEDLLRASAEVIGQEFAEQMVQRYTRYMQQASEVMLQELSDDAQELIALSASSAAQSAANESLVRTAIRESLIESWCDLMEDWS